MIRALFKWLSLGLAGAVILFLLASGIGAVWSRDTPELIEGGSPSEVFLVSGPIHFDFVLPLDARVRSRFEGILALPANHSHMLIGCGSKAFYTTAGAYSDVEIGAVWTALSGDEAVLRLDSFAGFDWQAYGGLRLELEPSQLAALLDFVEGSFERDAQGAVRRVEDAGLGVSDVFFQANGRFNGLRTCNVWVAEALSAAGVPVGVWTPTPIGLRMSLAVLDRRQ